MECRFCQSCNTRPLFRSLDVHGWHILSNNKFDIYQCFECGVIFPEILVNSEYYSRYYPNDYYSSETKSGFVNRMLLLFSKIVIRLKEFEILKYPGFKGFDKIRILDIGCGAGDFLVNLNSARFEKYGVEINPQGYKKCWERKLNIYAAELKDAQFKSDFFDVITMWHVLEHLDNPVDVLLEARKILKSTGILLISTPNTGSLGYTYGRKNWFHLDSPRHLILYDCKNISLLLERAGFKAKYFRNYFYDYPLDLFWSLRESKLRYFIYPLYPFFKILSREALTVMAVKDLNLKRSEA